MTDPTEYRKTSRERWEKSAEGWSAHREQLARAAMPVSLRMIEAIAPQPGHHLLELAAGIGDTGFLAAELVAPGGTLICSDFSPGMLTGAQERAAELGLTNVRFKQIDAESIDLEAGSLDGVLCRWGFMLMADPEAALRETRRVLKPGGRVALAAWAPPELNPWMVLPRRVLIDRGLGEAPDPDAPGPFSWADPALIEAMLAGAGFVEDVEIARVEFVQPYDSFEDWWETQSQLSPTFADQIAPLDAATIESVQADLRGAAAPFAGEGGALAFPAATWVAAATA